MYPEKLKFRPKPVNSKLELGTKTRIYCKADGRDKPRVWWLKDGSPDFPEHVEDRDGTLYFTTVEYSDAGRYTCIATSKQGDINATIQIDVVGKCGGETYLNHPCYKKVLFILLYASQITEIFNDR